MREFTYTGAAGDVIDLNNPQGMLIGQIRELRTRNWSYTVNRSQASGITLPSREAKAVALVSGGWDAIQFAHEVFDSDLVRGTPGTLTVNGWQQKSYIVKSEPDLVSPQLVCINYTMVLLDMWRHDLQTISFLPAARDQNSSWLNLPTNLPVNLMGMSRAAAVVNPGLMPMPWRMTVYGPASSPHVSIGGNMYQVNTAVPDGGYLTIDAVERTVVLTDEDGTRVNVFASALRGSGLGGGQYIFEPLPAGKSPVVWDNGFGFDLTPIEERSEPPWSI